MKKGSLVCLFVSFTSCDPVSTQSVNGAAMFPLDARFMWAATHTSLEQLQVSGSSNEGRIMPSLQV
jgi:hypothetical protein